VQGGSTKSAPPPAPASSGLPTTGRDTAPVLTGGLASLLGAWGLRRALRPEESDQT
jgi:hypothetical protein